MSSRNWHAIRVEALCRAFRGQRPPLGRDERLGLNIEITVARDFHGFAGWPCWAVKMTRTRQVEVPSLNGAKAFKAVVVPTREWTERLLVTVEGMAKDILGPQGDATRARAYYADHVYVQYRACTPAEVEMLAPSWASTPPNKNPNGPWKVLWTKGVGDRPAVQPCEAPRPLAVPTPDGRTVEVSADCRRCAPCRERQGILDAWNDRHGAASWC